MKKVTKTEQAKRKKVAQKRADYTKARTNKVAPKKSPLLSLLANKVKVGHTKKMS